jgi:membrane-associated protease RseP (regulator of RpoE activity)
VSSQDLPAPAYPTYAGNAIGVREQIPVARARNRYWLHALLFLLTVLTTTIVGAGMQWDFARNLPLDVEHDLETVSLLWKQPGLLWQGLPFSLTLLTILLAHEFGHYLACVHYRVDASLPYFLPAPTLTGTFGAFIRIRSALYSRRILFDIGVSGPVTGFVFLLPILAVGLAFSKVIPGIAFQGDVQFGTPALQWLLQKVIFPGVPTADIYLHPVARAAWVGILATALNLLPIGQLDGGHILYALIGDRHRLVSKAFIFLLVPLGIRYWWVWLFWAAMLFWLGRRHPPIYDNTDLGSGRVKLGYAALVIFALCFTVAPVSTRGF